MAEPPDNVKTPGTGTHPDIGAPPSAATPPPPPPPTRPRIKQFFLDPKFKWSLICVAAFTFIALVANIALAVFVANPSDEVKVLIDTVSTTYKMGFGALVGLVGGKAL